MTHVFPSWRLMALDVGNVRIGVAISDLDGIVVTPLQVIRRHPEQQSHTLLRSIITDRSIIGVVVGLPLSIDETYSQQTKTTYAWYQRFAAFIAPLPVITWDERYSTQDAETWLRDMGMRREKRHAFIDAAAAAVILRNYLDANIPVTVTRQVDSDASDPS